MATWSPDGRQLIYTQSVQGRGGALVVQTIATGELNIRPVAFANVFRPSWFPDGNAVAILAHDIEGHRGVFKIDLKTGAHSVLLQPVDNFAFLSPDGASMGYIRSGALIRRRIADGSEQVLTKAQSGTSVISPDGQSIARFVKTSIVVSPMAGGAERVVLENVPGALRRLSWSADSRHIFFTSSNNEIWRVSAEGGPAVDTGIRAELTKLISVNPDGRRIALSGGAAEVEVWLWENLLPRR